MKKHFPAIGPFDLRLMRFFFLRTTLAVFLVGLVIFLSGCGRRQLYPVAGNEFTLFPSDNHPPRAISCTGSTDERFRCFEKTFTERAQKFDIGGSLAITTADGNVMTVAHTDALNAAANLQADANTRFPAASITKMFLAAATVSLAAEGRVDLFQPIAHYLPELSADVGVGKATLHQLMTHTSGVGNFPQCTSEKDDLALLLSKHGKAPLWSPPGAVFNYSNMGYSFVALVLERVTGESFENIVRTRVLVPAGIPDAKFAFVDVKVRGHGRDSVTPAPRCRAMWPSGGLVLNVRELVTWVGQLSKPDSFKLGRSVLDQLTAPYVQTGGRPGETYGYGVMRIKHDGLTIFSHSGALEDFTAFAGWSPDRSFGVAAFVNGNPFGPSAMAAGFLTLSTFLDLSPNWRPEPKVEHPLSAYVGLYVDHAGTLGRLNVSLEGERLVIDYLDGLPPVLPANFRFAFADDSRQARYVVTAIGVGTRQSP